MTSFTQVHPSEAVQTYQRLQAGGTSEGVGEIEEIPE